MTNEMKKCPKCGSNLEESNFYRDTTTRDNLSIYCKKCINKYFKQYQKKEKKQLG
jgi:hypothetical protein